MKLNQYVETLNKRYQSGISREHSYRGDLQNVLQELAPEVLVTNEPARIACGAPDYVITKKDIPIGYIEAKDIGIDLKSKTLKEQFNRYKASLDNLIFTDYLDFHLYINGEFVTKIAIAEIQNGGIVPKRENFEAFQTLIRDFCTHVGQSIKSASKLSKMMAGKAKMLAQVIEKALISDEETQQNSTLREQMTAFKEILIHDIRPKDFADVYAQTIAYGMFAARLHDTTLNDFSRQEAASLIPKSNPFLRKLFQYISGYDLDSRIEWIVTALADIFRATDVKAILTNFGKATQMRDPIIHFYENFLAEYDPKLRKARGVWYTPEPVVKFIVRAVDDILKTEFGLKKGLADTSKTKIKLNSQIRDKRSKTGYKQIEKEVHKVQILDPATGTGTFLAEVVKHIYAKYFKSMKGLWSGYVEKDLIPRLNGFELLMASYAMAHLKLDLLLQETGYQAKSQQRFKIFLTNSLEEAHPDTGTLFASWLSAEANEANHIKRDAPVMVVLGNPPYSVSSSNKSEWIEELMKDYKKDLQEQNLNSLSDDYIKFIRYGQHFIDKNGEGILAYISNNSFIDGITHRQMRKHLLQSFDKIYILDLHGNAKKKETTPDGSPDQNVFDIQQGVSINIFIKSKLKGRKKNADVFHFDLQGKRIDKYSFLRKNVLSKINWKKLRCLPESYFFIPKDFSLKKDYEKHFHTLELFDKKGSGIKFRKDNLLVKNHFTISDVEEMLTDFKNLNDYEILQKYNFKETKDWIIKNQRHLFSTPNYNDILPVTYRVFDTRYTYYPLDRITQIIPRGDSRKSLMQNFAKDNYGLCLIRNNRDGASTYFIVNSLTTKDVMSSLDSTTVFPLYLYETTSSNIFNDSPRKPNLNPQILAEISQKLGLTFTPEKEEQAGTYAPIDLLDYIYTVLHSPNYREKYKEFLKIDFPRVPYPSNVETFWKLVALGGELRALHLLESEKLEEFITSYPQDGDNIITRKMTKRSIGYEAIDETQGKVWVNDEQYFDTVPLLAWEFYIGGYQPAQKWLKDRVGRELDFEDILHYQKIIVALTETSKLMRKIDDVLEV
ncbi:MAG: type ISP restriction/modification enzyme [Chitinophagales bacterium]